MSSDLFIPIKFNTSVQLKPKEIGSNIDEVLLLKIKKDLENMCSKHGYIKNNSIKIIKRSAGQLIITHFNGNIAYNLQCIAEICNPAQGSILKCRIKAKNALGLLAEGFYDNIPILQIIIPKLSAGIKSDIDIEKLKIGEEISIEVCGKKFLLYDKYISIIGRAINNKVEDIKNVFEEASETEEDEKAATEDDIINDVLNFDDDDEEMKSNYESSEGEDEEDEELSIDEEIEDDIDEELEEKFEDIEDD